MSTYGVGDRVRVTYEGEVTETRDKLRRLIELDGGLSCGFTGVSLPLCGAGVTVLERRKPKVGDVLTGNQVAEFDAPSGTVIYNRYGDHWMRGLGDWVCYTGVGVKSSAFKGASPFTVAYLPA